MLVRLTYASRASHSVSAELIREILDSSRRNNPANGLTGILCCNADTFLQALEGPRAAINALYNRGNIYFQQEKYALANQDFEASV